jgi:hypothetical protein
MSVRKFLRLEITGFGARGLLLQLRSVFGVSLRLAPVRLAALAQSRALARIRRAHRRQRRRVSCFGDATVAFNLGESTAAWLLRDFDTELLALCRSANRGQPCDRDAWRTRPSSDWAWNTPSGRKARHERNRPKNPPIVMRLPSRQVKLKRSNFGAQGIIPLDGVGIQLFANHAPEPRLYYAPRKRRSGTIASRYNLV